MAFVGASVVYKLIREKNKIEKRKKSSEILNFYPKLIPELPEPELELAPLLPELPPLVADAVEVVVRQAPRPATVVQ